VTAAAFSPAGPAPVGRPPVTPPAKSNVHAAVHFVGVSSASTAAIVARSHSPPSLSRQCPPALVRMGVQVPPLRAGPGVRPFPRLGALQRRRAAASPSRLRALTRVAGSAALTGSGAAWPAFASSCPPARRRGLPQGPGCGCCLALGAGVPLRPQRPCQQAPASAVRVGASCGGWR
jgi:hypothetical protein